MPFMRLLIIDGHNLLFQMFFGMPSRITNSCGKPIHGIIGFIGALGKLITMTAPTHVVVLFDSETQNSRKNILEEYKRNRPDWSLVPEEDNPFSQLESIYTCLDLLGIKHAEVKNAETDDVIASYATQYGNSAEIYISSYDSDYFQLITDRVKVIRYRGQCSRICDTQYIIDTLGIHPRYYADFKSMVGDSSDNIKGLHGVGPKTAAGLINEFGTLDEIIANADKIKKDRLRLTLIENTNVLYRNMSLIKLHGHTPLPFSKEELFYTNNPFRTMEIIHVAGVN